MKCNLGKLDRIFRFITGWILLFWGVYVVHDMVLRWLLSIIGLWALIESFVGWCGLHNIFNVNLKNQ